MTLVEMVVRWIGAVLLGGIIGVAAAVFLLGATLVIAIAVVVIKLNLARIKEVGENVTQAKDR
jgi:hypothetical protein